MDEQEIQILQGIATQIAEGKSRTDIVQSLINDEVSPQLAQSWYEVGDLFAAGQGYKGYNQWFWAIMLNKAVHPRGGAWLWLTAVVAVALCIPLTIAWVSTLPSGRYPTLLLVAPGILLAMGITYFGGMFFYKYATQRPA